MAVYILSPELSYSMIHYFKWINVKYSLVLVTSFRTLKQKSYKPQHIISKKILKKPCDAVSTAPAYSAAKL